MASFLALSLREVVISGFGGLALLAALSQGPLHTRVVPSQSMAPTLQVGDRLLIFSSRSGGSVQRGELVVFHPPFRKIPGEPQTGPDWMPWGQESVYVKRVIAVEGDVIQVISRHGVLINGQPLNEPYIVSPPRYDWGPHSVPDAHVVVLGDNRNDSFDSHHWGFLPVERIVGRPTLRLWPPSRWTFF